MTEEEVDLVAEELAKIGGVSWYPGREPGPLVRVVSDRYRDRARAAIAALDRFRAGNEPRASESDTHTDTTPLEADRGDSLKVGATIVYRPPGDPRAYVCIVDRIEEDRVHLTPQTVRGIGWVSIEAITPLARAEPLQDQR